MEIKHAPNEPKTIREILASSTPGRIAKVDFFREEGRESTDAYLSSPENRHSRTIPAIIEHQREALSATLGFFSAGAIRLEGTPEKPLYVVSLGESGFCRAHLKFDCPRTEYERTAFLQAFRTSLMEQLRKLRLPGDVVISVLPSLEQKRLTHTPEREAQLA